MGYAANTVKERLRKRLRDPKNPEAKKKLIDDLNALLRQGAKNMVAVDE